MEDTKSLLKKRNSSELKTELLAFDVEEKYGFESEKEKDWVNRQRVLLVGSRGIKAKARHLMTDLSHLLAHHKRETKIEKNQGIAEQLVESCDLKDCENILYFEQRRDRIYMFLGKASEGPTMKFQIEGISTADEMKMTGNCLRHSRALLSFDDGFKTDLNLKIFKNLAKDAFNTPKKHPKSQPFIDKIFHFGSYNGNVYFRNYQVYFYFYFYLYMCIFIFIIYI